MNKTEAIITGVNSNQTEFLDLKTKMVNCYDTFHF